MFFLAAAAPVRLCALWAVFHRSWAQGVSHSAFHTQLQMPVSIEQCDFTHSLMHGYQPTQCVFDGSLAGLNKTRCIEVDGYRKAR